MHSLDVNTQQLFLDVNGQQPSLDVNAQHALSQSRNVVSFKLKNYNSF